MKRSTAESLTNLFLPLALILGLVLLLNANAGQNPAEVRMGTPLESWLKIIVDYLAGAAEIAAALVIRAAVFRGIVTYIWQLSSRGQHVDATEGIRLQLASFGFGIGVYCGK